MSGTGNANEDQQLLGEVPLDEDNGTVLFRPAFYEEINHDQERPPAELSLPPDWLRSTWIFTEITTHSGMIAAFIMLALSSDPDKLVMDGILPRHAAIGTLVGLGKGVVSFFFHLIFSKVHSRCCPRENPDERSPLRSIEDKRHPLVPSASTFSPFDVRLYFCSLGIGFLISSVLKNVGGENVQMMSESLGSSFAVPPAAVFALVSNAFCASKLRKLFKMKTQTIKARHWYLESRHDVPFWLRIMAGISAGYVLMGALVSDTNLQAQAIAQLIGVLLLGAVSTASPIVFSAQKFLQDKFVCLQDKKIQHKAPAWFLSSTVDMPWYLRLFASVLGGSVFFETLLPQANLHEWVVGLVITFVSVTLVSPLIYSGYESLLSVCFKVIDKIKPELNLFSRFFDAPIPTPKIWRDMPFYGLLLFAALNASVLGNAIDYLVTDPTTYSFDAPPSLIPAMTLLVLTPLILFLTYAKMVFHKLREDCAHRHQNKHTSESLSVASSDYQRSPYSQKRIDLGMPWYVEVFFGLCLGARVGAAFGTLFFDGQHKDLIPGSLGPEWLGMDNQYGAPLGALIGGLITLLYSVMSFIGDEIGCRQKLSDCWQSHSICKRGFPKLAPQKTAEPTLTYPSQL